MNLTGIHHVTAVTGDAPANVAFYTETLGLRLVKKTVNQDEVTSYHLYYGDESGSPGTLITFFDWPWAAPHTTGAGMVSAISLGVSDRAEIEHWANRFDEMDVKHEGIAEKADGAALVFSDLEGQRLELVEVGSSRTDDPASSGGSIAGLDSVTTTVGNLAPTATVLTEAMGFEKVEETTDGSDRTATFEVGSGARVRVVESPGLAPHRRVGRGGVHHVAFRAPDAEEHAVWREWLARAGMRVTPVIDRYYFHSVYFREPGGVLFEIATDGPGFMVDEERSRVGEKLSLPPFLEDRREEIEAALKPIEARTKKEARTP